MYTEVQFQNEMNFYNTFLNTCKSKTNNIRAEIFKRVIIPILETRRL